MRVMTVQPRGQKVFVLRGTVDAAEAERLREALEACDPDAPIVVDVHDARLVHDVAVARLAWVLTGRRATVLGLSEHHLRLLRYVGLSGGVGEDLGHRGAGPWGVQDG